jgi:hypothetical protein
VVRSCGEFDLLRHRKVDVCGRSCRKSPMFSDSPRKKDKIPQIPADFRDWSLSHDAQVLLRNSVVRDMS